MHGARGFFREIHVAYWIGRNSIDGAAHSFIFQRESNYSRDIVQRNPGHPLLTGAKFSADKHLYGSQHARKRAATRAQNNSETQDCYARAKFRGAIAFAFPILANLRQKIGTGAAVVGEFFIAAISVISDGGNANENFRLRAERA